VTGTALAGLALAPPGVRAQSRFDVVIRGGLVVDGTGLAPYPADIGIVADRIAAVGSIAADQGRRVIDVAGLHVAPHALPDHGALDPRALPFPEGTTVLMTEKDAVKCAKYARPGWWYVELDVAIDRGTARDLIALVLERTGLTGAGVNLG
jgi:hypothetical protein